MPGGGGSYERDEGGDPGSDEESGEDSEESDGYKAPLSRRGDALRGRRESASESAMRRPSQRRERLCVGEMPRFAECASVHKQN